MFSVYVYVYLFTDEEEGEAEPDIDPFDLLDPVDILSKLPKDFYEKVGLNVKCNLSVSHDEGYKSIFNCW